MDWNYYIIKLFLVFTGGYANALPLVFSVNNVEGLQLSFMMLFVYPIIPGLTAVLLYLVKIGTEYNNERKRENSA